MSAIEVLLTVPEWVQSGLALGQFERVGGVVREVSSGRVVAWLRDGSQLLSDTPIAAASALQMTGALTGAGFVLNLALSAASLSAILLRLNRLQTGVTALHTEWDHERDTKFKNALEDARDAVEMTNPEARLNRADNAISALRKTSLHLHQSYAEAHEAGRLVEAAGYLVREIYAISAMVRCYLELGESELARQRLAERSAPIQGSIRKLIGSFLGAHPAVYLHKAVPEQAVRRFIAVLEWLHGKPFTEILIADLRADFWNDDALEEENQLLRELARRLRRPVGADHKSRIEQLNLIESLIENLRRIEGFELELRSMRLMGLGFGEWVDVADSTLDFAVLVPTEPLELTL